MEGAYYVDKVVICDAFSEPVAHYQTVGGGRAARTVGRRPSQRVAGVAPGGKGTQPQVQLFGGIGGTDPDLLNDEVNRLREQVRSWRESGYRSPPVSMVTQRLLEWWFDRDEERHRERKQFFFCQREAIETVIFLYEACGRRRMPETEDLVRYALKLATGTGKTVVMAMLITWSTLHKRKVGGSPLSTNFLVLVPNLTVRRRVSGEQRGDGLDPTGAENLYQAFDLVPPDYEDEFEPRVIVRNWQSIPLEASRDDWISDETGDEGRFIPAAVRKAMLRRARQDPNAVILRSIEGCRDLVIINDEAHHAYGEKRTRAGEDPSFIKWSRILQRVRRASRVGLCVDLSATPWYGAASAKAGQLFEWLVSDFSVYDAFESGLVKVVRLPDPREPGSVYLDLWSSVQGARTKEEYLLGCKGAVDAIYANWKVAYTEWESLLAFERDRLPPPVLLCVTQDAERTANWLREHLTSGFDLLRNPPGDDDPQNWVTIQIDSKTFDAQKGKEALIREMVDTAGKYGGKGRGVRCIVSVSMLSEGWDVKSVTHILGLRAFGSPLLTEQIVGRGLRRTSYESLYKPLDQRGDDTETVDAFGIPFVGFPVEKRKRAGSGSFGNTPKPIEVLASKARFAMQVPNVRSWAVAVSQTLTEVIAVGNLPEVVIDPKETPPEITVRPVVGNELVEVLDISEFRREWPLLRSAAELAKDVWEATNVGTGNELYGPTFDELFDLARVYVETRVRAKSAPAMQEDIGRWYWRQRAKDFLENAVRSAGSASIRPVPVAGKPAVLDTNTWRRFSWPGLLADGKKTHTNKVPCSSPLEVEFANFLDGAADVVRYLKNERFGFSVTYFEAGRPRQYFPDFITIVRNADGTETTWIAETKGEVHPNTALKSQAAQTWCARMESTGKGRWRYLFVPQAKYEQARRSGITTFAALVRALQSGATLRILSREEAKQLTTGNVVVPVTTLQAAAGKFSMGQVPEWIGWAEVLGERARPGLFAAMVVGDSMDKVAGNGAWCLWQSLRDAGVGAATAGEKLLARRPDGGDPDLGDFTFKRWDRDGKKQALVPMSTNAKHKPIKIGDGDEVEFVARFLKVLGG